MTIEEDREWINDGVDNKFLKLSLHKLQRGDIHCKRRCMARVLPVYSATRPAVLSCNCWPWGFFLAWGGTEKVRIVILIELTGLITYWSLTGYGLG